ncbi:hypothetical protein N7G274_003802 [Stereocaulon virgatum]|uniref:Rhodopsin domain-containing protein n=1 Tax=Stereocaulon virgatum TaxID=373712 RepID=A0ABR4ADC0_9LECA
MMANASDPGRGPLIISVSWMLTTVALILIAMRFHVRINILHTLGADDWIMLLAGVLLIISEACITEGYIWGLGKHDLDLSFEQLVNILKWDWITATFSILVSIAARISIAILLIRIFGNRKWFKIFLIVFTTLQSVVGIVLIVVVWEQCRPVQGLWNPTIPSRRWNPAIQQDLAYLLQSMFTFSDLTYVLIPVVLIWDLNMAIRHKLGLISVMSFGLFTMVASIMKTLTSQSSAKTADSEYNASIAVLWSAVEQSLVIIMGCVPPLRAVTKIQFPRLRSLAESLVRIIGSTHNSWTKNSSRFHSSSKHSTYQHFDLEDSAKRLHKENAHPYEDREFSVLGNDPKDGSAANPREHNNIRRTDTFTTSYSSSTEPKQTV